MALEKHNDLCCAALAGPTFAACAMGPAEATAVLLQAAEHGMGRLAEALLSLGADPTAKVCSPKSMLTCKAMRPAG